jgi:6-phosphogluconolactonase (cycloisomerase 2 family)
MKFTCALIALGALAVSGCGGNLAPSPGPPPAVAPDMSVYTANSQSSSISVFNLANMVESLDGEYFSLVPAPHSPFRVSNAPTALSVVSVTYSCGVVPFCENFYLAVVSAGKKTISLYNLDSYGGVGSLAASASTTYTPVAVTGGNFIYVADAEGYVSVYQFSNDALTEIPGSPFAAGEGPAALSTEGGWLYVANSKSGNISGFSVDAATGALTALPGSPYAAGIAPNSITLIPQGGVLVSSGAPAYFLVATNYGSGNVSVFSVNDDGSLAEVAGSPFAAGNGPSASVVVYPIGFIGAYLYVANSLSNNISGFHFDQSTGSLSPLSASPFPAGTHPSSLAVAGMGVFAASSGSNSLCAYTSEPSSGALTTIKGSPFPVGKSPQEVFFSFRQTPL